MHETMNEPSGIIGLTLAACSIASETTKELHGDDWRAVMVHALHDIELDDIADEEGRQGH